jgi:hypothetical protein
MLIHAMMVCGFTTIPIASNVIAEEDVFLLNRATSDEQPTRQRRVAKTKATIGEAFRKPDVKTCTVVIDVAILDHVD